MRKTARNAGLIFLATASVYSGQSLADSQSTPAAQNDVSVPADIPVDPFGQTTVVEPDASTGSVTASDVNYNADFGTVEIHVNDANLVEVLRMLSLQSQKNIVASKEVKGAVTANLYGVTVREALDAILKANGYVYREEGNFIYVYTAAEMQVMDQADRVRRTEVFRLFYTPAQTAVNMIKPVLSKDAEVAFNDAAKVGLSSGVGDSGGNSLSLEDVIVVTDFDDRLEEVRKLLKEIDRRPQQILIEATILRATLSEDNALGVDFQILGGVDFSSLSGLGGFGGAASGAVINNPAGGAVVDSGYAAVGTGFTGNVPDGGLRVGLVQNNIAVFLDALESVTDTIVMANPKVLALNKQKGEVIVGREDGYMTSTVTESSTIQTVEFLQTGTRLIFRPFIADDGFIRLEVHPEDSSGGLTNANLPFKVTTEITTNVMVKDGHTVVIGGLFREDSNSTRGQVPFLGNLPMAGALFRSQRDRTTREEIIILLTPHIVKDENVFAKMSEEELRRMNQLRVGVRRGMMPFGRERLAESSYDAAVSEMNKSNPNKKLAMWHLNSATNLNPKFSEAIELKEQISGVQVTSVDNSLGRSFVSRMILRDVKADASEPTPAAPTGPQASGVSQSSIEAVVAMPFEPTPAPTEPSPVEPVVAVATRPEEWDVSNEEDFFTSLFNDATESLARSARWLGFTVEMPEIATAPADEPEAEPTANVEDK
jgi:type IV pilus assembly protein PilQ